ncbi:hypothetical protein [Kitasatospora sp. DSM 101779]|uniref:hypothetical protein n=1 Tax=Kitasatospora sp. DSM 101779 TaxID=2853165 RepID=UPI0021DABF98|nr:hypothetical protein [Kitasatospora sp. DSM 101779]MCU7825522.1 hypothetical protein [Kitasatospora sp. DSM 101779]
MPDRRSAAASAVLAGLLVLGPAATAHAHGDTIALTVTGTTAGHPQATARWENDRDPVEERIAGTFSATAPDGTTLGPWRLVAVPGRPGALTTAEVLPPGHWTVTAETAFPGLGRYQGALDVPVTDPPGSAPSAGPTATTQGPTAATPGPTAVTGSPGTVADPVPAGTAAPSGGPGPGTDSASDDDRGRPAWLLALAGLGTAVLALGAVAAAVHILRRSARS